jgi:Spy/CpxP family protein refolding chaperone
VNKHAFRIAAALVGASAAVAMGALSVAAAATQAQPGPVVPQHFGGPVYTSIYNPTATLGMPTLASSSTDTPTPLSAPG